MNIIKNQRIPMGLSLILVLSLTSACGIQSSDIAEKDADSEIKTSSEDYLPDTSSWTKSLTDNELLSVNLDGDKLADEIILSYEDYEGSQRIRDFYVSINESYKIGLSENGDKLSDEQRDMTLENVLAFDYNKDLQPEFVFLFDTHGAGGNGTHVAWILWVDDNPRFEMLDCLEYYAEGEGDCTEGGLDTLYKIERVEGDDSKMKTYQYSYLDGHSDYNGDLVSLIGYDNDHDELMVLDSWKENND
ncbi:MAG: hypothetical protein K6G30_02960 [Acetatifactor sp.]|nr:hypothetical protein [Acetatifactor sp.]